MSNVEQVWNEAQKFARELLNEKWLDKNWAELPKSVREQFSALVSEDIPREFFGAPR